MIARVAMLQLTYLEESGDSQSRNGAVDLP